MRHYDIIKIWALILLVLGSWQLHAQDDNWDDEGEIEDAEVVIEKDRQIELPPANRSYEKVAPLPLQIDQREQSYNFERVPFESTQFTPNIRVLTIKEQPLPKLYGNYIKAGIGNYGTGYLEGYFNNKRNDTYVIGARLKSLASSRGPVAKENSASSDLTLGFDASYFTEGVTFNGQAEYERIKRFYYGVPTDVEPEKQIYNKVLVGLGLADSNKNPDIDYAFNATYTSFEDRFDVSEDQGSFDFTGTFKFNDQVTFAVNSDLHLSQFKAGGNSINRSFFRFTPTVHTTIDVFRMELGINVVYENDTIQNADKIHLSPVAKASYNISTNIKSGIEVNAFPDLTF